MPVEEMGIVVVDTEKLTISVDRNWWVICTACGAQLEDFSYRDEVRDEDGEIIKCPVCFRHSFKIMRFA